MTTDVDGPNGKLYGEINDLETLQVVISRQILVMKLLDFKKLSTDDI